ncbi:hypothetical protein CFP65_0491 [Kitasatospora sp. MMS16-BH015]|uniref:DUF11 domain-containing protein n=1 Tax=Kitasatospora sp. MMS16-BH015 TaxID=2018025 RepID=UPI000CA0FC78|nr:DUF11 domain-containing protein [Kitasatospora sp. MMS16-BH015]AUG75454.1 hypothetical protein CFP65_0491 [Kitasatospora sp. MMS16-BH015]
MLRSSRPPRALLGATLAVALLLLAPGGLAARAADGPAPAPSTLVKSVQDVTHPGAAAADHGDTVGWTVNYTNGAAGGAAAPATVTDRIVGAGTAQSYVPGSLHVPPGWTPSWSTDGSTFTGTDQGAATTAVRADNPVARAGGTGVSAPLLAPVQAAAQATGGDGFTPVLYRTAAGEVQSWSIYHHAAIGAPQLVCNSLSTGQLCAGGPWPRPLNTAAGPLGTGRTGDIGSPLTPQYVFDPQQPNLLYYPAVTTGSVGVGCLDLAAQANCGYTALAPTGTSPSSANSLAGLVKAGGSVYGVATTGQVLCLTLATRQPCAGQPYAPVVAPNHDLPSTPTALYLGGLIVVGEKVFASSSPQTSGSTVTGPPVLGCFDTAANTTCAGWDTPHPAGPNAGYYTYDAFASYSTAGQPDGVCTSTVGGANVLTTCYGLDGSAHAAPGTLAALAGNVLTFNPETVTAGGATRSYFPAWGGSVPGATLCHDWTANAPCAGFPLPAGHPGVNGGATRDYGYSYDATTRCLIGLGDGGVVFSLDPATAASPCVHSGATVTLKPGDFYCDGAAGHVQQYGKARLTDLDLSHVDLAASHVLVTDADGTPVLAPALGADGTVDLASLNATAHPAVTVTVQLVLTGTGDFTSTNHPALVAEFQGDAPQFCFRTVVTADCATTQLTNTATGTDATGALTSNTVTTAVAPGTGCRPNVTVEKEICGSGNWHDCAPGGPGPWAKTSPVGLLGLLGTAHWRITVTNAGPVDAANVTVNDAVTPGCRQAAGSFSLASGASRQVYCDSFLLALPLKNTASASFVAAGAPAGTPPSTSAPSAAVACSLLCILAVPDKN